MPDNYQEYEDESGYAGEDNLAADKETGDTPVEVEKGWGQETKNDRKCVVRQVMKRTREQVEMVQRIKRKGLGSQPSLGPRACAGPRPTGCGGPG